MANTIPFSLIVNATTASTTVAQSSGATPSTTSAPDDKKPVKTFLKGLFIKADGGYQTGNANLPYDENKDTYKETKESGRKEHHAPGQRGGLGEVAVGGRYSLFSDSPVYAGGQVGLRLDRLRDKDRGSKDEQGNELVEGLQGRMALPLDLRLDAGFRTDTWSIGAFFAYSPDALSVWSVNSGADESDLGDLGIGDTTQHDGVSAYGVTEALTPSDLRSFTYGLEGTLKLARGLDGNLDLFTRSNRFDALISTTGKTETFRNNEVGATAGLTFTPGELVRKTSTPATGTTQQPTTPQPPQNKCKDPGGIVVPNLPTRQQLEGRRSEIEAGLKEVGMPADARLTVEDREITVENNGKFFAWETPVYVIHLSNGTESVLLPKDKNLSGMLDKIDALVATQRAYISTLTTEITNILAALPVDKIMWNINRPTPDDLAKIQQASAGITKSSTEDEIKAAYARVLAVLWDPAKPEKQNMIKKASYNDLSKQTTIDRVVTLHQALSKLPDIGIGIAGHASSDGTDEHNQKLSEDRAKAVRDTLLLGSFTNMAYGSGEGVQWGDTTKAGHAVGMINEGGGPFTAEKSRRDIQKYTKLYAYSIATQNVIPNVAGSATTSSGTTVSADPSFWDNFILAETQPTGITPGGTRSNPEVPYKEATLDFTGTKDGETPAIKDPTARTFDDPYQAARKRYEACETEYEKKVKVYNQANGIITVTPASTGSPSGGGGGLGGPGD